MTTNELRQRVEVILSQSARVALYEFPPPPSGEELEGEVEALMFTETAKRQLRGSAPAAFVWECDGPKPRMVNEQVMLLKLLYASADAESKVTFPVMLAVALNETTAAIIAHALVELGLVATICDIPAPYKDGHLLRWASGVALWHAVRLKLALEPELFTDADIRQLELATDGLLTTIPIKKLPTGYQYFAGGTIPEPDPALFVELHAFKETVARLRYLRLRDQLLAGENPEVNTDREVLVSRMEALGFPGEVVAVLREVERKLNAAGAPIVFKECLDLLRSVFEHIVVQSAIAVAAMKGDTPPTGGPFQPHKQFLRNSGVLASDNEADLFQKFYNYLSMQGAHALGSAPEQARVAKNMTVELSLMLVGRIQSLAGTAG